MSLQVTRSADVGDTSGQTAMQQAEQSNLLQHQDSTNNQPSSTAAANKQSFASRFSSADQGPQKRRRIEAPRPEQQEFRRHSVISIDDKSDGCSEDVMVELEGLYDNDISYVYGDTVELKDGDFIRISRIYLIVQTGEVFIDGERFRRQRYMDTIMPNKLNEVCLIKYEPDNALPGSIEDGMANIHDIVQHRQLIKTNFLFPEFTYRMTSPLLDTDIVEHNYPLVCRFKCPMAYVKKRNEEERLSITDGILALTPEESDVGYRKSTQELRSEWRTRIVEAESATKKKDGKASSKERVYIDIDDEDDDVIYLGHSPEYKFDLRSSPSPPPPPSTVLTPVPSPNLKNPFRNLPVEPLDLNQIAQAGPSRFNVDTDVNSNAMDTENLGVGPSDSSVVETIHIDLTLDNTDTEEVLEPSDSNVVDAVERVEADTTENAEVGPSHITVVDVVDNVEADPTSDAMDTTENVGAEHPHSNVVNVVDNVKANSTSDAVDTIENVRAELPRSNVVGAVDNVAADPTPNTMGTSENVGVEASQSNVLNADERAEANLTSNAVHTTENAGVEPHSNVVGAVDNVEREATSIAMGTTENIRLELPHSNVVGTVDNVQTEATSNAMNATENSVVAPQSNVVDVTANVEPAQDTVPTAETQPITIDLTGDDNPAPATVPTANPSSPVIIDITGDDDPTPATVPTEDSSCPVMIDLTGDGDEPNAKVYTFGDSFCGAGGMSRGALQAGLRIKWGFDSSLSAIFSYKLNFKGARCKCVSVDEFIKSFDGEKYHVDVLHMSPPCQPFSPAHTVANEFYDEPNEAALFSIVGLVKMIKPRMVTLEQTPGLLRFRNHRYYFYTILNDLISLGFSVKWKCINFLSYGVPQARNRLVMFAAAPGEIMPEFPKPTHGYGEGLKPFVTIKDAVIKIPDWATHNDKSSLIRLTKQPYSMDAQLRGCITTSGGVNNYYPDGTRHFTCREFACLQTFPPYHQFGKTHVKRQIGNAVPPVAAEAILREVIKALKQTDSQRGERAGERPARERANREREDRERREQADRARRERAEREMAEWEQATRERREQAEREMAEWEQADREWREQAGREWREHADREMAEWERGLEQIDREEEDWERANLEFVDREWANRQ